MMELASVRRQLNGAAASQCRKTKGLTPPRSPDHHWRES